MKELETRVVDIDVDKIREILKSYGAQKVKEEYQINDIYDFEDNRLLEAKGYARIRITDDRLNNKEVVYMTTKKMLSQGTFKEMEENETIVYDKEAAKKIFISLGLTLKQSIKKYRESYKIKNSLVEIDINDKDFCPFPYLEIETSSEEELNEVLEFLGYSIKDTTSKTIYELLEERGLATGKGKGL
ncbi:MAG: CYTH domain-containing protein [Clostridium sartagoforme]|nr:CYTH domain-containing protein [Clostridium sartagoforme]